MKHALILAVAIAPLALASAGCTRTSDGSVEMPEPQLVSTRVPGVKLLVLRRPSFEPPARMTRFPPPPDRTEAPHAGSPARRQPSRARRPTPAPQSRSGEDVPGKALVCRNTESPGGRVRVVCD